MSPSRGRRPDAAAPIDDLFGEVAPALTSGRAPRPPDGDDEPPVATAQAPITEHPELTPDPTSGPPKRRGRGVLPAAVDRKLTELGTALPESIRLGTSSWSFPGWNGLVYGDEYGNSALARGGLNAYAAHPLLRSVSIDRSFYAPLTLAEYAAYAAQTPAHFRFIVKAHSLITDTVLRGERGIPTGPNPCFLNVDLALREFITPCIEGLGSRAGALVFQFSPLPDEWLAQPAVWIERVGAFLSALPALPPGVWYAVEIRDRVLLTPRLIKMLQATGTRYCIAIHARMPDARRQAAALALLDEVAPGPLIVRWSLHAGFKYEQAKAKYEPFNRLVDEDPATHATLAQLAAHYALAGQAVIITANNKAEGSAPLTCFKLSAAIVEILRTGAVSTAAVSTSAVSTSAESTAATSRDIAAVADDGGSAAA